MAQLLLRPARAWIPLLALVLALGLMGGCSGDDSTIGPGPGGTVGPIGPVGPTGEADGISGSGTITVETRIDKRDVAIFNEIVFRSEGTVIVTTGPTASLAIETDDNLHQYLEVTLTGTTLEISTADDTDIAPTDPPVYRIDLPGLRSVELAGAGTITIDSVTTDRLEVALTGAGDITIGTVSLDELLVDLSGVGTLTVDGVTDRQEVRIAGVTTYEASSLESRTATVEAAGSSDATLWVSETVDVTAADTAVVGYYGTPALTQSISDLGVVTALGEK